MILKIRIHSWPHVEQCQEWQAQINPPGGKQDLTTDCALDPSGREAICDRGKNVLSMSPRRPQLQGNLAQVARNYEKSRHRIELEPVGLKGTPQCLH